MSSYNLTHLKQLEAESIHIIREVAAEFNNPVMLYSIGKDSSVMVQLALKAFYPARPPFPLLHVDTTWKFREMIAFRESYVREKLGLKLLVHINEEGTQRGIHPLDDSEKHTELMKTDALKQALDKYEFDAAFGGARRDEEKSRAKERVYSFRDRNHTWDPKNQRPELWNLYNSRVNKGESIRVFPLVQLDGAGCLAIHPSGTDSHCAAVPLCQTPGGETRWRPAAGGRRAIAVAARRKADDEIRPFSHPWLLSA